MGAAGVINAGETKTGQVKQQPAPPAISQPKATVTKTGSVSDQEAYQNQQEQLKADSLYQQRLNQIKQVKTVQAKQDLIRNINDLQESYSRDVSSRSYKQSESNPILPEQKTYKNLSEATESFNNLKVPETTPVTLKSTEPTETNTFIIKPETKTSGLAYGGTSSKNPQYSEATKRFNLSTEQTLSFLEKAKEAGITKIDIFNEKGEKIAETNPQNIVKARYDILTQSLQTHGKVTYSYVITTEKTVTQPIIPQQENEAVSFLKFPFIGEKYSSSSIPSTSLFNVVQLLPIGLGTKSVMIASDIVKPTTSSLAKAIYIAKTESSIAKIQSALRENNLIIGAETTKNPKVIQISQGTISKSGIESFKPEKAAIQVERLTPNTVKAVEPALPTNLKETQTITTIGRKGEAKPVEVPTVVKLEPGLEGTAKIPSAFVNLEKEGSILLVRQQAQKTFQPNAVLVSFQGISKEKAAAQAEFYGLTKVQGMKNEYYGKLTPELIEKLNFDTKKEAVITGTDIFQISKKDFLADKELYSKISQEPKLWEEASSQRPFTKPFVIRYFEAKGLSKSEILERRPLKEEETTPKLPNEFPKQSLEEVKERYPLAKSFEPSQIGTGLLETGKTSEGASSRLTNIISETKQSITTTKEASFSSNLPSHGDYIMETIRVPAKSTNVLSTKVSTISQTTSTERLNRNVSDTLNLTKEETRQSNKPDLSIKQTPKSDTIEILFPGQTTKQTTIQTTKQTTIKDTISGGGETELTTRTPPPDIPKNLFFSEKEKKKKTKKGKLGIFLGNVPQSSIIGVYKREDVIYNPKQINKLTRQETKEANKPWGKFINQKSRKIKTKFPKERFTKPKGKKFKEIKF